MMIDVDLNPHRNYKGKQDLPYLLSTTKSLAKSKRYFYRGFNYLFNCKRNRDCYTERNVRINMTRMWHNIIIPNAILCRESGFKPKFQDAIDALNHAMRNGKTDRSMTMWRQICKDEAALPKDQQVVYKYRRSFYYYVLGMAATKNGLLYSLPKKKVITLNEYWQKLSRFIFDSLPKSYKWECPWDGLNTLVYRWKHYNDEYDQRCAERQLRISELEKSKPYWDFSESDKRKRDEIDAKIQQIEDEGDDDSPPDFPKTLRAICDEFDVSMTTAQQFKLWLKQYYKYDHEKAWSDECREISWPLPKAMRDESKPDKADSDFIDLDAKADNADDDADDVDIPSDDAEIEHDIQSAVNSGNRPQGRWDKEDEDEDPLSPF